MGILVRNEQFYAGSQPTEDAKTVNGHTVEADVPANAKFTDTLYNDIVFVRTGRFAVPGESMMIYSPINLPISNPVVTVDFDGTYFCTCDNGMDVIFRTSDLVNGPWAQWKPNGVNYPIRQIIYSPASRCWYIVTTEFTIYCSSDFSNWYTTTFNTDDLDAICIKAIPADDGTYFLCNNGELCFSKASLTHCIDPVSIVHPEASDFFELHNCYIFQGGEMNPVATIYDEMGQPVTKSDELMPDTNVDVRKMVYCYGKLFAITINGDILMCDARHYEEIINSKWVWIDFKCQFSTDMETIIDEKKDIFVSNNKLYIVGAEGLYCVNRDLEVTAMQSERQQINVTTYDTYSVTTDQGILYKRDHNTAILFHYEYEELDSPTAIQRIYNKLV